MLKSMNEHDLHIYFFKNRDKEIRFVAYFYGIVGRITIVYDNFVGKLKRTQATLDISFFVVGNNYDRYFIYCIHIIRIMPRMKSSSN